MATKTITIKEEAYNRLKKLKNDKSFSDIILDLTEDRKVDLMESFNTITEEEAAEAKEKIAEFREKLDNDADQSRLS